MIGQRGNIFLALFGVVALMGVIGVSVSQFMRGPLSSATNLTRSNKAEQQMQMAGQLLVSTSAALANSGDCDSDGFIEPIEPRDATTNPKPVGGGYLPTSIGVTKLDPWGTEYGYCVWNHGSVTTAGGCAGTGRLVGFNGSSQIAVSVISAGKDKIFQTTCSDYADTTPADGNPDVPLVTKTSGSDDIINSYTYAEAEALGGDLWSLKSGNPDIATIAKNLEIAGSLSLTGGLILPDQTTSGPCNAANVDQIRRNTTTNPPTLEICYDSDPGPGQTWTWGQISGSGTSGGTGLVINPAVSNGMDVDGICGNPTCYSSDVTFTITNNLGVASSAFTVGLSNTTNFEFVSNDCDDPGIVPLADGGMCNVVVRAKATGNTAYTGVLQVTGNNSPIAVLDGLSTGFGCIPGRVAPGGIYVACNVSGLYDLITTPSGCTASTVNPTCAGGADTLTMAYGSTATTVINFARLDTQLDGAQNTVDLAARQGGSVIFNPPNHCNNLTYGGKTDWFLPSYGDLANHITPNRVAINWNLAATFYWSSNSHTPGSGVEWYAWNPNAGSGVYQNAANIHRVRCVRREPYVFPSASADTTPDAVTFTTSMGTGASETRTSNTVTIGGVVGAITVSLSGPGSPQVSKNGGAYDPGPITVTNGDTITLQATSGGAGTERTIVATLGASSATWLVRTVNTGDIRIFVTSGTYSGGRGGLAGANATCTSVANAAGMSGSWTAMLGTTDSSLANIMPWSFTTMRNMLGQVVATSQANFLDGSISNHFSYSQTGAANGNNYWTAMQFAGLGISTNCDGWTNGTGSAQARFANNAQTGAGYYFSNSASSDHVCSTLYSLACIENAPVSGDTTPNTLTFTTSMGTVAAEVRNSNTVTIGGVSEPVSVTISGGTSPEFRINGGAWGTTGTINNGDTLQLRATSPGSGQEAITTVTVGASSFPYTVRTIAANTIRVFTRNATTNGAIGGAGGADSLCTTSANAAGLPGNWVAVIGADPVGSTVRTRLPWNWTALRNMSGALVATSLDDFMDGSVAAPMNLTEYGTPAAASTIWTGLVATGATGNNCDNWSSSSGAGHYYADSSATSGGGYFYVAGTSCGGGRRLLCMEVTDAGSDTDPNPVNLTPAVVFSSGGTGSSNIVTINGITTATPVTITPSAGTADILVNGISSGTSTTVGLNQTLQFTLTAPAVLGTRNTATINIGPDSYSWWSGYADSAREAKAFVTSTGHAGSFGGLAGADAICNARAAASPLGLTNAWKAILSDSATDAINRLPWNWGVLKTVDGTTVVNGGFPDLWDGTLDMPLSVDENGTTGVSAGIFSGTFSTGTKATENCINWTSPVAAHNYGLTTSATSTWIYNSPSWSCSSARLSCIEDVDAGGADSDPNSFVPNYVIQVAASSRQSSNIITIGGMSSGATQTISVSATGGTPRVKINGGAEVTSGTIANGDTVQFVMDAPAADGTGNRMTITAGSMTTYWRVFAGDSTGIAVKRVFVTAVGNTGGLGGVAAYDAGCTSRATTAGLGGTWKAIMSGITEPEWAISRVGYNWSELRLVTGTTVVFAPNLWTGSLINPITKTESSGDQIGVAILSNTRTTGLPYSTISDASSCHNWTSLGGTPNPWIGNSSSITWAWISQTHGPSSCSNPVRFYCIEQ